MQELWKQVDCYFSERLAPISTDYALEAALKANRAAGLPAIDVSRLQGKFLELLVRICGARRILEIGTLGGYSTIWMARALPEDGRIVSLEVNPRHAEVARANLLNAGVADRVDIRVGLAIESLSLLASSGSGPFDLIFIDADKQNNAEYLAWALKLSHPGTVIVTDNVVRDGKIVQADCTEADIEGIRRFTELLATEPRLSATVVQTVGAKGYDGFALAIVLR
ncbi:MAG: O-methyltransferase [Terracidiphilus sp.]|jgi:predicted O-methyltransferase YrrM